MRKENIVIRVTKEEKELLNEVARLNGLNLSAYIRFIALKYSLPKQP